MLASACSEAKCCRSRALCGLRALQPQQRRLQRMLLTEASPPLPWSLVLWDQGQFRQVLSLEESSLRPPGSLNSRCPFFSPVKILIWGSHPWSERLHCRCPQSWPLCPGGLHLNPHPLSWLPGFTMDRPHHYNHRTTSDPGDHIQAQTDPTIDLLTWPPCLTSDLLCRCGLVWRSGLLAEDVIIMRPALLPCPDAPGWHPCWWGHCLCVYRARLLAALPAETCDAAFCLLQWLQPSHLWADSEK